MSEPLANEDGVPPGTKVVWIERDGELNPCPVLPWRDLYGYLRAKPGRQSLTDALLGQRRADREREDV